MRGATIKKAVLASVGVHVLLAGFAFVLLRWQPSPGTAVAPSIETRADVRFEFASEETSPATELSPPPQVSTAPPSEPKPTESEVSGPPLVQTVAIPRTLPSEVMGLVKKNSAPTPVVEVPMSSTHVEQSSAKSIPTTEPKWAAGRPALHGALGSKQSIVYVLDASGSMGEWGKFDAARGALIATLRLQPETVRFQVVVYSGNASLPLRGAPGACLPATPGNIAKAIEALQALAAPSGRSNHAEGVRSALTFRPDIVLILTDADDLPGTQLRGVVRQSELFTKLCVATVSAQGVAAPVEVK